MIAGLKPYPVMKDSGVEQLGKVPEHWSVRELGRIGAFFKGNGGTKEDEVADGVPCVRYGDLYTRHRYYIEQAKSCVSEARAAAYTPIRFGDVLFSGSGETIEEIGKSAVNLLDEPACCGGDVIVFRPSINLEPRFLGLATDCPQAAYQKSCMGRGITVMHIYGSELKYLSIALPPGPEQAAIVRYLDHVDRRVRRLVRAKRKLIALLTEQKQAIIHRAVTRGLDPDVHLKDSGVEWLGEVPAHWKVVRLRRLVRRIDQGVSPQAEAVLADDGWWGVLKSGCVNGGVFRQLEHKRLPNDFKVNEDLAVSVGDVLISRACGSPRFVGSVGRVVELSYRLILCDKTFRPIFEVPELVNFAVRAMNSRYFRTQVELAVSGAEGLANNLPLSALKDLWLAVPPLDEAVRIAESLDAQLGEADAAIEKANREIDLLTEYRTRLTADVVTGKLDVREVAAALPEVDALATDDEPETYDVEPDTELDELAGVEAEAS